MQKKMMGCWDVSNYAIAKEFIAEARRTRLAGLEPKYVHFQLAMAAEYRRRG